MKLVISIGGSILTKELSTENFKKYADVILKLKKKGHDIIVVCGGGKVCREYQAIARGLKADDEQLDFIGIMATHLNASTFSACLGKFGHLIKWKSLKETMKEIKENFGKKILVAGGYDVGTSSDYDATIFADWVKADLLINVTNVDGVYSDDPKKNPYAKKYDRLSYDDFANIISKNVQAPGEYRLFDLPAAKLIKKARIKTVFIDGNDPEEIIRAVEGKHSGTIIG
jgi:uridylate kinase